MKLLLLSTLFLIPVALYAQEAPTFTVLRQSLQQGGFLVGQAPVGGTVTLNGTQTPLGKKGEFAVGFDRNAPLTSQLKVCDSAGECTTQTLKLTGRTWVTQNVTKIPQETVTPNEEEIKRTEEDSAASAEARKQAAAAAARFTAFTKSFKYPIDMEPSKATSGVFGSRRTYNGEERSWHKGADFAAKVGTPVHAPANGIVRLARNTFMSGNLLVLDHGGAITTAYAHLSKFNVKVGDEVKAGDIIGYVGTTGRSSGPHLHWGTYWQNTALDPILWVKN